MSDPLRFVPPRVALTDPNTGMISRQWYLFFQGVFNRIGGSGGVSNPDLEASLFEDAGSSETNAMIATVEQAFGQVPPSYTQEVSVLTTEVFNLQAQVAELLKEIEALKQSSPL